MVFLTIILKKNVISKKKKKLLLKDKVWKSIFVLCNYFNGIKYASSLKTPHLGCWSPVGRSGGEGEVSGEDSRGRRMSAVPAGTRTYSQPQVPILSWGATLRPVVCGVPRREGRTLPMFLC